MTGDFSRVTFRREKHYSGVLIQQGRVITDATLNEEQAIRLYHDEIANRDIIGKHGAPRETAGFELRVQGNQIQIGNGRYYVDGILVENDSEHFANEQLGGFNLENALVSQKAAIGLAYLDVWQRHISVLHDPSIREKALGGPDDSARLQTWWRLNMLALPSANERLDTIREMLIEKMNQRADLRTERQGTRNTSRRRELLQQIDAISDDIIDLLASANITCNSQFDEFRRIIPIGTGRMTAQANEETGAAEPCSLPEDAGFTGLENQLYRVQIFRSGTRSTAGFVFSRENGNVTERITEFNGTEIRLESFGRDLNLGFGDISSYDFVEIFNDETEALGINGELLRVVDINEDETLLVLANAPTQISTDLALNPKIRRWDQPASRFSTGIMRLNNPDIELENGITVSFESGRYLEGDYWLIPARTAPVSDIEWTPDGAHPPDGTRHHVAPIAFIYRDPLTGNIDILSDCRNIFPPLTAITADDVSFDDNVCELGADTVQEAIETLCRSQRGMCTLTLSPDSDISAELATIPDGADAYICLQLGDYILNEAIELKNKGCLKIIGSGLGTHLRAPNLENALLIENCDSVIVRDLSATTSATNRADELGGTLEFRNCGDVTVEQTFLQCGHGLSRRAACIKVRNSRTHVNDSQGYVRIQHNTLKVGHLQSGMIVINSIRAQINDNVLMTYPKPATFNLRSFARENELTYLQPISRNLLSNFVTVTSTSDTDTHTLMENVSRNLEERMDLNTISGERDLIELSLTDDNLVNMISPDAALSADDWEAALNAANIEINDFELADSGTISRVVDEMAYNILVNEGRIAASNNWEAWFDRAVSDDRAVMGQGIVIAGEIARDTRILNNTIRTCIQGIHIGLSRSDSTTLSTDLLTIAQNNVHVSLPTAATQERHGIFAGNCESCTIFNNHLSIERFRTTNRLSIEAIRVYGVWGQRVEVKENHVHNRESNAFTTGIRMNPLRSVAPRRWRVKDNLASVRVTGEFQNAVIVSDNIST